MSVRVAAVWPLLLRYTSKRSDRTRSETITDETISKIHSAKEDRRSVKGYLDDPDGFSADRAKTGDRALLNLIGLIAFSIITPVLIPRFAPHLSISPMWIPPAVLLTGSIITCALFFAAIVCDLDSAPETTVSCEQTTIAMNCPPAQLWSEIDRDFQRSWDRGIPNRAYENVPPDVASGERGSFGGIVL
jgi:hypothetical protein